MKLNLAASLLIMTSALPIQVAAADRDQVSRSMTCPRLWNKLSQVRTRLPVDLGRSPPRGKLKEVPHRDAYKRDRNGLWFEDEAGRLWFGISGESTPEHNPSLEIVSSEIYRQLGYDVHEVHSRVVGGRRMSLYRVDPESPKTLADSIPDTSMFRQLRVVAAYLKDSWRMDLDGLNTFSAGNVEYPRYQASLAMREVFEKTSDLRVILDSFRVDPIAKNHPWTRLQPEDFKQVATRFRSLTDERLRAIVSEARFENGEDAADILEALIQRRNAIVQNLLVHVTSPIRPAPRRAPVPLPPAHFARGLPPKIRPGETVRAEILGQRMIAVHSTHFFPEDGVIRAGSADVSAGPSIAKEPPSARATTHWSIGEQVRSFNFSSWEDRPFAILTTLESLRPQLINVNTYDTFAMGDVRVPEGAVAVIPLDFKGQIPAGMMVHRYDRSKMKLRQAVDEAIQAHGGWKVDMQEDVLPDEFARAKIDGVEVNSPEFWKDFMKKNPGVSFGGHLSSMRGSAYRLGLLDIGINDLVKKLLKTGYQGVSTPALQSYLILLRHHSNEITREIATRGFTTPVRELFEQKSAQLRSFLNFAELELELRTQHGVTLSALDEHAQEGVLSLRYEPDAMRKLVFEGMKVSRLPKFKPDQDPLTLDWLAKGMYSMPAQEQDSVLKRFSQSGALTPAQAHGVTAISLMNRSLMVEPSVFMDEALGSRISASARALLALRQDDPARRESVQSLLKIMNEPKKAKALERPEIQRLLQGTELRQLLGAN